MSGPTPGQPVRPFGGPPGMPSAAPMGGFGYAPPGPPPSPMSVSPERMSPPPPPVVPQPPLQQRPQKGGRRRVILVILLAAVLLGGGAAVAALVFPNLTGGNSNTVTNTNVSTVNRTNTNTVANANRSNSNATPTNVNTANRNAANDNVNAANVNAPANTNAANVNTVANVNTNTPANTNVAVNQNTNTRPASYSADSDGDKLNDYLEEWIGTSRTNADSDSDGFPDGNEVTNKYSPLGDGKMEAAGYQAFCSRSTVVLQYSLPSSDVSTLCGIGSDLITDIQVMATNADFYEDLNTNLTGACTSFGKLAADVCAGLTSFTVVDYLVSS